VLFSESRRLEGVEVLPAGLSDEEAIARAKALLAKRKGPFDSFEVWEGSRFRPASSGSTQTRIRPSAPGAAAPFVFGSIRLRAW
jgi:hypothetical protein